MDSKSGIGITVIGFGLIQMVGSITGNVAPMLAALFQPNLLVTKSGSSAVPKPSLGGYLHNWWNTVGPWAGRIIP